MLSVWRCKFESVEKCDSGWSKVQYVCGTIMLPLCFYRTIVEWKKCICCMIEDETTVIMQRLLNGLAGE